MARALYKKQKKLIDKYVEDNPECNFLYIEALEKLEKIYDWECLWQHANSYFMDKRIELTHIKNKF